MTAVNDPSSLRILYVGEMLADSTSLQRYEALQRLVGTIKAIKTRKHRHEPLNLPALVNRVIAKLYLTGIASFVPLDPLLVNQTLIEAAKEMQPDILWLDKALTVRTQTLIKFRHQHPTCRIIGYSPDDMGKQINRSAAFDAHAKLYDLFFTTKSYGPTDLKSLGCQDACFIGNAFDPELHRPLDPSPADRERLGGPVTFVGTYEADRAQQMAALCRAGITVRIWGSGWQHMDTPPSGLHLESRAIYGEDYTRALCASDINLCFLRKHNRDRQTTRSIEIPACGAFMLAERTDEHLALFEEGVEAAFFSSTSELIEKCLHYLAHPDERQRIAAAGRERCLKSGYSNDDRMSIMLQEISQLKSGSKS